MTHAGMEESARLRAGIGAGLLRVSVGIEDPADLVADLRAGLERAPLKCSQHRISGGTRRNRRRPAAARSAGSAPASMARDDGRFERARLGFELQRVAQQQRGAQDRGIGIGDAAAGDVRRGSMDGFEHSAARARRRAMPRAAVPWSRRASRLRR